MASVLAGREGNEYGAKSGIKKKKTGGCEAHHAPGSVLHNSVCACPPFLQFQTAGCTRCMCAPRHSCHHNAAFTMHLMSPRLLTAAADRCCCRRRAQRAREAEEEVPAAGGPRRPDAQPQGQGAQQELQDELQGPPGGQQVAGGGGGGRWWRVFVVALAACGGCLVAARWLPAAGWRWARALLAAETRRSRSGSASLQLRLHATLQQPPQPGKAVPGVRC